MGFFDSLRMTIERHADLSISPEWAYWLSRRCLPHEPNAIVGLPTARPRFACHRAEGWFPMSASAFHSGRPGIARVSPRCFPQGANPLTRCVSDVGATRRIAPTANGYFVIGARMVSFSAHSRRVEASVLHRRDFDHHYVVRVHGSGEEARVHAVVLASDDVLYPAGAAIVNA